jgi:hypothetical protein
MYRIIGADGREYGPISLEQLGRWIVEGRANAETKTIVEGSTEWEPLGSLPEFSSWFGKAIPPTPPRPTPSVITGPVPLKTTNPFALAGFVLGILSLCCFCCYGLPFNLLGLIFSIIGLVQIEKNPQLYHGKAIAITGLVLCILSMVFGMGLLALWGTGGAWRRFPHRALRL